MDADDDAEIAAALRVVAPTPLDRIAAWLGEPRAYRLTRSLLLRLLGVVYLFAFLALTKQVVPLLGADGLTPIVRLLEHQGSRGVGIVDLPTIFWFDASDATLVAAAWVGVALSVAVVLGYANAPVMLVLWILYGSFERVGDLWFGFGWEIQLLETGFLAIFLAPALDPRPLASRPPSFVVIVLYRWLTFRIMLGAGLIKIRGDACWRELTCLDYHFETQPIPNPVSPWLHHAPHALHVAGVVFNHIVELIAPWFALFGPRRLRLVAAVLMLGFQVSLIVSGNLAFLNWLTVIPIIACFDDDFLRRLHPARIRAWLDRRIARANAGGRDRPSRAAHIVAVCLAVVVGFKSIDVVLNLASSHQVMNHSYDRLALVNTYGAFGSVGDVRHELVIEGTRDEDPGDAEWLAYELPCKPGDLDRPLCVIGPYHYRLDWLIWFAAMYDGPVGRARWVLLVVKKLLVADASLRTLLAVDPFGDDPPRWIRIRRFQYHFAAPGDGGWVRDHEEPWLDPVSLADFTAR